MVKHGAMRLVPLLAVLSLAACELFTVSPFPGYVAKTDISLDMASRISSIAGGASPLTYDLNVIDQPGLPPRVLLLVNPPSSDPSLGFDYKGKLVFMDQDLNVLGQASTANSLTYFSRPYSYAADNNVLAGYSVLDASGNAVRPPLTPTSLQGFAFTDGTDTYIFSSPGGLYASFDLSYAIYSNAWGVLSSGQTLQIIPPAARPSTSDPNYANLGYQLIGLTFDTSTSTITFVLSEPAEGRIEAARLDLATATSGTGVLLSGATSWPVGESAWPLSVTVDRPELHADVNGFFLVQRDGWMTRYAWTPSGPLSQVGSVVKIVGDRSLSRHYAFLLPQSGGPQYMYRFDPASRMLTRYTRWW